MSAVKSSDILADLAEAEAANNQRLSRNRISCPVCRALESMDDRVAEAVREALGGTIGRDRLVKILVAHGYDVGRRSLERHRQEGHP